MLWLYSPLEKQFGTTYHKWEKTFIPTDFVVSLLGNYLTKIIERMKKRKIFYTKMLILALSIIMKHWKQFREPWEKDGRRFPLRASNCWDTGSLTVLWWKSSSLQVLSFLIFPHLLWKSTYACTFSKYSLGKIFFKNIESHHPEISTNHMHFFFFNFFLSVRMHPLHTCLKNRMILYGVGQKVRLCFSITSYRKSKWTFWPTQHICFYHYFWY